MPSTFEPEKRDSVPSPAAKAPFEHPNDECECGHRRELHGNLTESRSGQTVCLAKLPNDEYADDCHKFFLGKTALQVMVDNAQPGDTIRVHGGDAADVIDLITRLKSSGRAGVNEQCTCGHAALVHAGGTGNCLAHGFSEQDDSHCLEFHAQKLYCGACGHPHHLHDDYLRCQMRDCACSVQEPVTEHPETDCTCGDEDVHTYGDPNCRAFWNAREDGDEPEDRDMWFPGAPAPEPADEPASPMDLPGRVAAYRVIYATEDGALHAIDVPYGVNASVIAGQLRLWHAGTQIAGITANITSVEESTSP